MDSSHIISDSNQVEPKKKGKNKKMDKVHKLIKRKS